MSGVLVALALALASAPTDGSAVAPGRTVKSASATASPSKPDLAKAPPPAEPRWVDLPADTRAATLETLRRLALRERLLEVSRRFIDTPYLVSPLGEGEGQSPDPDPLERYDAVDCLTFVEETLALALAASDDEVSSLLQEIRYAQGISYADRNHLMEAQWLPNNAAKRFLRDATRQYGGADVITTQKVLTRATWQSKSSQALQLPEDRRVVGKYAFPLLPIDKVMRHARAIPSGTLLVVVREDLPQKATRITHLGFVVQKKKRTYLRHAARNTYGRVVDEDLETFLLRNSKYEKWRVTGVSLFEVLPRASTPTVADSSTQ